MISGGSASNSNVVGPISSSLHTTTTTSNSSASNDNNNNNNTQILPQQQQHQQEASSLTSFLTSQQGVVNNNNNNNNTTPITTTILASGGGEQISQQQSSHHAIVIGGANTNTSLLPPLAKSTPIMTTTTLNGTSAANQPSSSSTTSQFVPIAPATSNPHNNSLSVQPAHSSDHVAEHHTKSVPSNSSVNVSNNNVPSNVSSSQQARRPKPVQIGFMPPVSLCVLMEQMASKIHQHYQPQKPASSSKKSELSSQKKDVAGESSSTLNSNSSEDAKKTETMLTDDKTNNQSNETNANVISTSRNVSSTSQGRSKSPGSTPSLYDILNEEYHSNYSNYQELIHATNLIVEFLYGNTDLKERYHPFHSQFASQQHPSFSWVYMVPPDQTPPVMYPSAPSTIGSSSSHSGVAIPISTPVKSGRGTRSDITPTSNFKSASTGSSSAASSHDTLEIPPPVFAMPKPNNGSSEASTPMRVRIAPNTGGGTAMLPIPEHQHISPFPIRAKEEDLMEEDKRKRRISKKPETGEGTTGSDEQENKFVCYICDKSVIDKSTKYTLTSSNFSSFHEVFPHLKTPLLGESKRICANCYHKKYRNSRKKKADDKKDVISQGSSNVMSVDAQSESYEPTYCCCVCKKNGSDEFTETNFVNVQNYRSYLTYFPFISDTPTADRQIPVCDACHATYLQAENQEKKRKFMHMPNIPNAVDTLESLNKKLKPDTSHL